MIRFSTAIVILAAMAIFSGCRSKEPLVLYKPGEVKAYQVADLEGIRAQSEQREKVTLQTSKGEIVIELFRDEAPVSVSNFLRYLEEGFYSGTVFHRVIPGFMIQGGGFTPDLEQKPTYDPIRNEAGNGLRNQRGTVAMARTTDVDSATAQFFINLSDNSFLNGNGRTGGYAVFGRVVSGMDIVDAIALVPTHSVGPLDDVPVDPVIIERARVAGE